MKLLDGVLFAALAFPIAAQSQLPASPQIESIDYAGLTPAQQKLVAARLSVHNGDLLSADAKQRVAADLRTTGLELTFSYTAGSRYGTARLKISSGC